MKNAMKTMTFLVLFLSTSSVTYAANEAPAHAALRILFGHLQDSVNKMDIDAILTDLHPNVVVTWQDAKVSRRVDGVRDYLIQKTRGPEAIVKHFKMTMNVDELTSLYGDNTGIAFGSSVDEFDLATGQKFTLNSRWTATVIKVNGRWLLASFHISASLFDNPLLHAAERSLKWGVGISFALALIIGLFIGRLKGRRP